MIRITRAELPDSVSDRLSALTKRVGEAEDVKRAAEAPRIWRLASTRAHVHAPLDHVLRQMAPGLGQCMYCGDTGTGIDHFEPISRNPLRTFDWFNHLLACATCNSQAKGDAFPADAHGQPLLIDPTAEDPFDHLRLSLPFGRYEPLTDKGWTTIEVCSLNRPQLEDGRVQSLRVVSTCMERWATAREADDTAKMDEMVLTVQSQPFADVCQSMLRQAVAPGADIVFADTPGILILLRDADLRGALFN
jgi:5-methylcytosine-specific restriction endonuclease McrA